MSTQSHRTHSRHFRRLAAARPHLSHVPAASLRWSRYVINPWMAGNVHTSFARPCRRPVAIAFIRRSLKLPTSELIDPQPGLSRHGLHCLTPASCTTASSSSAASFTPSARLRKQHFPPLVSICRLCRRRCSARDGPSKGERRCALLPPTAHALWAGYGPPHDA